MARSLGAKWGLLTLGLNLLKGWFGCWLAYYMSGSIEFSYFAGVLVVAGHCFSVPPLLQGGKGVATALGTLFFLPSAVVVALVVFGFVFYTSRA